MRRYIITGIIIAGLLGAIQWLHSDLKKANSERDRYRNNTGVLLSEVEHYKVRDSLNAVTAGNLELRLSEYQKYRADDAAVIQSLQTRNRDLDRVITAQMQTIYVLQGSVRDSLIYVEIERETFRSDSVKCIDISETWFDLHACIIDDKFTGTMTSRDSLVIVETVKYNRFLGFLWKTGKVKNRKLDAMSKNPHTEIIDMEFITIKHN